MNNLNGVSNFGHGDVDEKVEEQIVSTEKVETVDEVVESVIVPEESSEEAPKEESEESAELETQ